MTTPESTQHNSPHFKEIQTIQIPIDVTAFFRAISIAYYSEDNFHILMRGWVVNSMLRLGYSHSDLKTLGTHDVWITPHGTKVLEILAEILNVRILFYEYYRASQTIKKYMYGDGSQSIKILRKDDNHYEVLKFNIDIECAKK